MYFSKYNQFITSFTTITNIKLLVVQTYIWPSVRGRSYIARYTSGGGGLPFYRITYMGKVASLGSKLPP